MFSKETKRSSTLRKFHSANTAFIHALWTVVLLASTTSAQTLGPKSDASPGTNGIITAIVGGTIIDVTSFGKASNDVPNSVVLIRDGHILDVGRAGTLAVPAGARRIDAAGTYLIPGLIDGFGALRTQGFADAYLYEGVTTVFVQQSLAGEDGEVKFIHAEPSPDVLRGLMIGGYAVDGSTSQVHPWTQRRLFDPRLSASELRARVDQIAASERAA